VVLSGRAVGAAQREGWDVGHDESLERFRQQFQEMGRLLEGEPDAQDIARVRLWMDRRRGMLSPLLAALVADRYFLEGATLSAMAAEMGSSQQSLSGLVSRHGPREYVAVHPEGDGYELLRVPVETPESGGRALSATRARLRELLDQGWRVAPARLEVDADAVDARELWLRLAPS